jgi:hypothetical protein
VQFKSVSCHVISFHLNPINTTKDKKTDKSSDKPVAAIIVPYRPRIPPTKSSLKENSPCPDEKAKDKPINNGKDKKSNDAIRNESENKAIVGHDKRSDCESNKRKRKEPKSKRRRVLESGSEIDTEDVLIVPDDKSVQDAENKKNVDAEKSKSADLFVKLSKESDDLEDDGILRVCALNVTIKRKGLDGKIWAWKIQKGNGPLAVEYK